MSDEMEVNGPLPLPGLVRTDAEIRIDLLRMLHEIPAGDNRFAMRNSPREKAALEVLYQIGLVDRNPMGGGVFVYCITPNGRRLME